MDEKVDEKRRSALKTIGAGVLAGGAILASARLGHAISPITNNAVFKNALGANTSADIGVFAGGSGGGGGEPPLGNPAVDGQVLSSTTTGTRSWISPPSGSGQEKARVYSDTTIDLEGLQTIDGKALVEGDRVLINNEALPERWPYITLDFSSLNMSTWTTDLQGKYFVITLHDNNGWDYDSGWTVHYLIYFNIDGGASDPTPYPDPNPDGSSGTWQYWTGTSIDLDSTMDKEQIKTAVKNYLETRDVFGTGRVHIIGDTIQAWSNYAYGAPWFTFYAIDSSGMSGSNVSATIKHNAASDKETAIYTASAGTWTLVKDLATSEIAPVYIQEGQRYAKHSFVYLQEMLVPFTMQVNYVYKQSSLTGGGSPGTFNLVLGRQQNVVFDFSGVSSISSLNNQYFYCWFYGGTDSNYQYWWFNVDGTGTDPDPLSGDGDYDNYNGRELYIDTTEITTVEQLTEYVRNAITEQPFDQTGYSINSTSYRVFIDTGTFKIMELSNGTATQISITKLSEDTSYAGIYYEQSGPWIKIEGINNGDLISCYDGSWQNQTWVKVESGFKLIQQGMMTRELLNEKIVGDSDININEADVNVLWIVNGLNSDLTVNLPNGTLDPDTQIGFQLINCGDNRLTINFGNACDGLQIRHLFNNEMLVVKPTGQGGGFYTKVTGHQNPQSAWLYPPGHIAPSVMDACHPGGVWGRMPSWTAINQDTCRMIDTTQSPSYGFRIRRTGLYFVELSVYTVYHPENLPGFECTVAKTGNFADGAIFDAAAFPSNQVITDGYKVCNYSCVATMNEGETWLLYVGWAPYSTGLTGVYGGYPLVSHLRFTELLDY